MGLLFTQLIRICIFALEKRIVADNNTLKPRTPFNLLETEDIQFRFLHNLWHNEEGNRSKGSFRVLT